jgi:Zn-dependent protease
MRNAAGPARVITHSMPTKQGSIRLFRFHGIDVFLHWSWFLVAIWEIQAGAGRRYSSVAWNVAEYLALFLIVLTHEFGHALACRQVGGQANQIVLWPFGGVAYVQPPPRAGATLWSIAAGPLVNVVLVPVFFGLGLWGRSHGIPQTWPDLFALLKAVAVINLVLLLFNLLPIYPLDGGQILRALLWFVLGRARSLMVATVLGFIGLAGYFLLAFYLRSVWLSLIGVFLLMNCWAGLQSARALARLAEVPRRDGFACPNCRARPPLGNAWRCSACKQLFDTFQTQAVCPFCSTRFPDTHCLECGTASPIAQWAAPATAKSAP